VKMVEPVRDYELKAFLMNAILEATRREVE